MERQRVQKPRSALPHVRRSLEPAERETDPGVANTLLAPRITDGSASQLGHSLSRLHVFAKADPSAHPPTLGTSVPYIAREEAAPTASGGGFAPTVFTPWREA